MLHAWNAMLMLTVDCDSTNASKSFLSLFRFRYSFPGSKIFTFQTSERVMHNLFNYKTNTTPLFNSTNKSYITFPSSLTASNLMLHNHKCESVFSTHSYADADSHFNLSRLPSPARLLSSLCNTQWIKWKASFFLFQVALKLQLSIKLENLFSLKGKRNCSVFPIVSFLQQFHRKCKMEQILFPSKIGSLPMH
jgi:hypothetical protein